jgi:predicted AAA+ superfamily ATPase
VHLLDRFLSLAIPRCGAVRRHALNKVSNLSFSDQPLQVVTNSPLRGEFFTIAGYNFAMYNRHLTSRLLTILSDTPVVLLHGARQTGKTTLVRALAAEAHPAEYVTFDDAALLNLAQSDPQGFLQGSHRNLVLDEVQLVPEIFPAIKMAVDTDRRPGRFLLTGSANVYLVPRLSETLAGRIEIVTMHPLSQGEIRDTRDAFIDKLFGTALPLPMFNSMMERMELVRCMLHGGYPESLMRADAFRRRDWFQSYITTLLHRDVRDLSNIERLSLMPRLLALLAARVSSTLNMADVARGLQLAHTTLTRYLALLEAIFLVRLVPAWFTNYSKRLTKSPKLYLNDTGLISSLLDLDENRVLNDGVLLGALLENFVVMELLKQIEWSRTRPRLYHFRTQNGYEVDIVLESPSGKLVGLEVKASMNLRANDFKGLKTLAEAAGERFVHGVILYPGQHSVSFGENLSAVPLQALWET